MSENEILDYLLNDSIKTKPSTRSCKAKGRRLQNLVAKKIIELTGLPKTDVKPAIMGEGGIDIKLSQAARDIFPFAVECKAHEKLNIWSALEQATNSAVKENLEPLVIFKRSNSKTYVVIELNYFFKLLHKLKKILQKK